MKKVSTCLIVTAIAGLIIFGACGNSDTSEQQPVTPASGTEPAADTGVADLSEDMPEESPETESPEEDFSVFAQDIIDLVTAQAEEYPQIPMQELISLIYAMNYDFIPDEEKETIMGIYGLTYEDLNTYYYEYLQHYLDVLSASEAYYTGYEDYIDPGYDMYDWIDYEDICLNPELKPFCSKFDTYKTDQLTTRDWFLKPSGGRYKKSDAVNCVDIVVNNTIYYYIDEPEMAENVYEREMNQ